MQRFLDEIKANFPQYKRNVDDYHARETLPWKNSFVSLALSDEDQRSPFYKAVFNVIRHFLNEDILHEGVIPEQLFIQIPMEELGRTDTKQRVNLNMLHDVVASALFYATAEQLRSETQCRRIQNTSIGDLFYTQSEKLSGCWEIMQSTQTVYGLRPKLRGFSYGTTEAVQLFEELCDSTIRLSDDPMNADSPHGRTANIRSITECFNKVKQFSLPSLGFPIQYSSAEIVGYIDSWCNTGSLVGNKFITSPVSFSRNLMLVKKMPEVLVLIGYRKYKNFERIINSALAEGKVKKVIYIGSSIFEGYDSDLRNVRYSFSFRELFTYFYGQYPNIQFYKFEFPWLFERLAQLSEILVQTNTPEEYRKSILTIVAYKFLGMDFDQIPKDFATSIKDRLLFDFGLTDEALDALLDSLDFQAKNPKVVAKEHMTRNNQCLIVSDKKRVIYEYVKNGRNKHNQKVIIDVRGDWRGYIEIIESLLSQSIFGEYNIYSYTDLPRIQAFFEKEPKVYNNPYRVDLLSGCSFRIINTLTRLSDYFDPSMLDSLLRMENTSTPKNVAYTLHGKSGTVSVTGDVIYVDSTKPLYELMEEKDDIFPAELTYYVQPSNFEQLMEIYVDLPEGEDVAYFSSLWKERLRRYCDSTYLGDAKKMAKKDFPFMVRQLKNSYISKDNPIKFPDCMIRLTIQMHRLSLITEGEQKLLLAAYNLNKRNQAFGRDLKEALYVYYTSDGKRKMPILDAIELNARKRSLNIDAETIVKMALVTDLFTDITKDK